MKNLINSLFKWIKELSFFNIFNYLLKSLMIILLPLAIIIVIYLHHQDYTILRDIFDQSIADKAGKFTKTGYDYFIAFYKMPISLGALWLAVTTLFFTLARIMLTDKQLMLMDKQQKQSILPDLHLITDRLICETEKAVFGPMQKEVYRTAHERMPENRIMIFSEKNDHDKDSNPILEVVNIGLHSSKEIRARFAYNLDDIKVLFQRLNQACDEQRFIIDINGLSIRISTKSKNYENQYNGFYEFGIQGFDFLLPANNNEIIKIKYPKSYFELFVFYLELLNELKVKIADNVMVQQKIDFS